MQKVTFKNNNLSLSYQIVMYVTKTRKKHIVINMQSCVAKKFRCNENRRFKMKIVWGGRRDVEGAGVERERERREGERER